MAQKKRINLVSRWKKEHEAGITQIFYPEISPRLNMIGVVYHHLTVIRPEYYCLSRFKWYYRCLCSCGKEHVCCGWSGTNLSATSCGCQRGLKAKARQKKRAARRAEKKMLGEIEANMKGRSSSAGTGNDDWHSLSGLPRSSRLARIPELGSFEKERLAKRNSKVTIARANKARTYDSYGGLPFGQFGAVTI